jgi:hypothetical protein
MLRANQRLLRISDNHRAQWIALDELIPILCPFGSPRHWIHNEGAVR